MSEDKHVEYFRQRAAAERAFATQAPDQYVARIHEQMAECYEDLMEAPERRDELKIVGETRPTA